MAANQSYAQCPKAARAKRHQMLTCSLGYSALKMAQNLPDSAAKLRTQNCCHMLMKMAHLGNLEKILKQKHPRKYIHKFSRLIRFNSRCRILCNLSSFPQASCAASPTHATRRPARSSRRHQTSRPSFFSCLDELLEGDRGVRGAG